MQNKSFTLIELLVVIVIIGILAGVIIVSVSSSINKANFAKAQSFSNTVQNELLGDLVSEWTFNSPAVANITEDSWGNNDGTLVGANGLPQLQIKENCVYGTCYLFDGVDDYIGISNNNLSFGTEDFTIFVWIKHVSTLSGTHRGIFSFGEGGIGLGQYYFYISSDLRKLRFLDGENGEVFVDSNTVVADNLWHFVGVSREGNVLKFYNNGSDDGVYDTFFLNKDYDYAGVCRIGLRNDNRFFSGSIDDVRIYNAALSAAQIKQNYIAGLNSLLANNNISKEEYDQRLNNLAYEK